MAHPAIPLAILALSTAAMLAAPSDVAQAQVLVHERITIRLPRMPVAPVPRVAPPQREWQEHKGPKCVAIGTLTGASIVAPSSVDLLMTDGRWIRARLEGDCRSADFYTGLYIRPGPDGQVCADRDAIRVRSGAKCGIDGFKVLKPRK